MSSKVLFFFLLLGPDHSVQICLIASSEHLVSITVTWHRSFKGTGRTKLLTLVDMFLSPTVTVGCSGLLRNEWLSRIAVQELRIDDEQPKLTTLSCKGTGLFHTNDPYFITLLLLPVAVASNHTSLLQVKSGVACLPDERRLIWWYLLSWNFGR